MEDDVLLLLIIPDFQNGRRCFASFEKYWSSRACKARLTQVILVKED
jgi:hypothetical protein